MDFEVLSGPLSKECFVEPSSVASLFGHLAECFAISAEPHSCLIPVPSSENHCCTRNLRTTFPSALSSSDFRVVAQCDVTSDAGANPHESRVQACSRQ